MRSGSGETCEVEQAPFFVRSKQRRRPHHTGGPRLNSGAERSTAYGIKTETDFAFGRVSKQKLRAG